MGTVLGHGRYGDFLRGHLGIDSNKPAASELLPDLTSTLDLRGRDEDSYLALERRLFCFASRAAVAAEFSTVEIRNPTDSGILTVVTHAAASTTTAGANLPSWGVASTSFTPGADNVVISASDTRWGSFTIPNVIGATVIRGGVGVNNFLLSGFLPVGAFGTVTIFVLPPGDIIISPGRFFHVVSSVVNQPLNVWLRYYERPFLSTELRSAP